MTASVTTVLSAEDQRRAPYARAVEDLWRGVRLAPLWGAMGWFDIRQRYSRSVIGPFWLTLSLAAFVAGLGVTYSALLHMSLSDYIPYLTIGMLLWTFVATMLTEGCSVFVVAEVAIKQMPAPLTIHVYRVVWRALIILGHNALVAAVVLVVFRPADLLSGLVPALAGMAIIVLNGVATALTLGTLGARFRDLPPLMLNITSMLFFVTPVLWQTQNLGDRAWIALANPIYHLIELVRAPLLGEAVPVLSWEVALGFTAANLVVGLLFYARFRWRIPYWL